MFERFTDRARRVIVLAQEQARMLGHNHIGTEHILLGLTDEREGVAAKALESLGISQEAATRQVEEIIGRGQAAPTGQIPFTPRAKKVLELALRESRQLGHRYIGTEHLLLGLVREGDGVGAETLQTLGASLVQVRQAVLRLLPEGAADLPPDAGSGTQRAEEEGPRTKDPVATFEEREKIVLSLVAEGLSREQIAETLGVPATTIEGIVEAIIGQLRRIAGD